MIDKNGMYGFLQHSVLYPCSGQDTSPLQYLLKAGFKKYVYIDYSQPGISIRDLRPLSIYEATDCVEIMHKVWSAETGLTFREKNWSGDYRCHISEDNESHADLVSFELRESIEPFMCDESWAHRMEFDAGVEYPEFVNDPVLTGIRNNRMPERFQILFVHDEAVDAYSRIYLARGISPQVLIYKRPGCGFGGCYSEFPSLMDKALSESVVMPEYILHDDIGGNPCCGDFLEIINDYSPISDFEYYDAKYEHHTSLKLRKYTNPKTRQDYD